MNTTKVPIIAVPGNDEGNNSVELSDVFAESISDENFAEDKDCAEQVHNLQSLLLWTRTERTSLEEEWNAIRRMVMLQHDSGQKYHGRSNAYLPVYSRTKATLVSNLAQGLFPSDEYFDVYDRGIGDAERAKAVKAYMQWEFETVAHVRTKMKPFLGQLVDLGTSPLKFWYKKELKSEGRLNKKRDLAKLLRAEPEYNMASTYEGLCVSTRNLLSTYVYPVSADSMDEVQVVFEDIAVPRTFVQEMGRKGRWANIDAALSAPMQPNWLSNQQRLLQDLGQVSAPETGPANSTEVGARRLLTEVWLDLRLPKRALFKHEDPAEPVPCKVVLAGSTILEVRRNPFWHQCKPYLFSRLNVKPGFFYGDGFGRIQRHLQYLANDFVNQTNDCGIYGLNPMAMINVNLMAGPIPPLKPGAVYQVLGDGAIKFERPPADLVQWGLAMVNATTGFAQDLGGAPPILSGIGGGKAGKTATQSQIMQRNAQGPLQDIIEDIEAEVLQPLLHKSWINAQQYRNEEVMFAVAGQPLKVSKVDLAIDAEFRWLASSQAVNQQVRAQQVMQLLQTVLNPAIMGTLQMQGVQVNPVPLLKRLYSDGFGFRGFDDFIQKVPPMDPSMGPIGPEAGLQPPGAQPDRMRSAAEQGGSEQPIQPGEAEDFMNVRQEADLTAAGYGDMGPSGSGELE